jgi:lipid-binding SYLF domain-containing protein
MKSEAIPIGIVVGMLIVGLALGACSHSGTTSSPRSANDSSVKRELADRFDDATELIAQFKNSMAPPVLKRARCVAVVPSMLKGGLIVGARHGRGFATCRFASGWSAPAPIVISGGSAGLQIGFESADVLMVILTENGMKRLMQSKVTLGADMSVSAGPVGRGREVDTDAAMKSEAVSYSRSRGLFAGLELNGAVLEQDFEATGSLYGARMGFHGILGGDVAAPSEARRFLTAVADTF